MRPAPPLIAELCFDRVVLRVEGDTRELTSEQFLEIPLSARIRLVLERSAEFYRSGESVDWNDALNSLRRARSG